jgi:hypothetical protein
MLTSMNYVNIVGIWARTLSRVDTRLVVNEQNASRSRRRIRPAAAIARCRG